MGWVSSASATWWFVKLRLGRNTHNPDNAISIYLLHRRVVSENDQARHCFQRVNLPNGQPLEKSIEVCSVELTKDGLDPSAISRRDKLGPGVILLFHALQ